MKILFSEVIDTLRGSLSNRDSEVAEVIPAEFFCFAG